MSGVTDEEMAVVSAIKQSFETYAGPGSAVNANPNPFFINTNGSFDLLQAARLVLARVDALRAVKAEAAAKAAAAAGTSAGTPGA